MGRYSEFWKEILSQFKNEIKDYDAAFTKEIPNSGIEKLGNRTTTGYNGFLELFACQVKRIYNSSTVYRNLAELLKKDVYFRNKLTGFLKISIDKNHTVHIEYTPFTIELMMNRYRDYQGKTGMEGELYKWEVVKQGNSLFSQYKSVEINFSELIKSLPWSNLQSTFVKPVWKATLEKFPEEMESAFELLHDEKYNHERNALQKRIDDFKSEMEVLYENLNDSRFKTSGLEERAYATTLTFIDPTHYTFYMDGFYSNLARCLEGGPMPAGQKLEHYYRLVDEFIAGPLNDYEDVISIKNKLIEGDQYYKDKDNRLLAQDIFFVTLLNDNYKKDEDTNDRDFTFENLIQFIDLNLSKIEENEIRLVANKQSNHWAWFADNSGLLQSISAHYETIMQDGEVYAALHFEDKSNNIVFSQRINNLPKEYEWIDWHNAKSIRLTKGYGLDDENVVESLTNDLLKLEEDFGDPVRDIVRELRNPSKQYWIYAPGKKGEMWNEFYNQEIMALGWDNLGDLSRYENKVAIQKELQKIYQTDKSKKNDATANYDFLSRMRDGDIIFVKKGRKQLLGYGEVDSSYFYDIDARAYKSRRKVKWKAKGSWKTDHNLVVKTLTDITHYPAEDPKFEKYHQKLMSLMNITIDKPMLAAPINKILYGPPGTGKTYKLKNDLFKLYEERETSLSVEENFKRIAEDITWWQASSLALIELGGSGTVTDIISNRWLRAIAEANNAKNVRASVWGTLQSHTIEESKTVNFKRRLTPFIFDKKPNSVWEILLENVEEQCPEIFEIKESADNFLPKATNIISRYVFTTFHQAFAYEDFIEGIKPVLSDDTDGEVSYHIEDGIFKRICTRAEQDPKNKYAIFIDEINRGNIANIFGELITLIETNKRKGMEDAISVILPYSKQAFSVPPNLDIYGTMNTADRSIEALDSALRRRFVFEELMPKPSLLDTLPEEISKWHGLSLKNVLETMNRRIEVLIDRDHQIGHAYFLKLKNIKSIDHDLKSIFANEIIPLLQEYFYNDYVKIGMVLGRGFIVVKEVEDGLFSEIKGSVASDYSDDVYEIHPMLKETEFDLKGALEILLNNSLDE